MSLVADLNRDAASGAPSCRLAARAARQTDTSSLPDRLSSSRPSASDGRPLMRAAMPDKPLKSESVTARGSSVAASCSRDCASGPRPRAIMVWAAALRADKRPCGGAAAASADCACRRRRRLETGTGGKSKRRVRTAASARARALSGGGDKVPSICTATPSGRVRKTVRSESGSATTPCQLGSMLNSGTRYPTGTPGPDARNVPPRRCCPVAGAATTTL